MKTAQLGAVVALGIAVSGCATIIQGTTQPVSVSTTPEQGAQCTLKNTEGVWSVVSPGVVEVHKTKNDLTVDCAKAGFGPGRLVAPAHFGGTTFGNVILGGAAGLAIDAASGANYYYDSPLTVKLGPAGAGGAAPTTTTMAMIDPNNQPAHVDPAYPHKPPPYPDTAQLNGEQGTVVLDVKVGSNGKVRNVKIARTSGYDDLDNAAIEGVLGWRFVPALENGEYSTEWTTMTITFQLPPLPAAPPAAPAAQPAPPPPAH
jgi:TonB family protein